MDFDKILKAGKVVAAIAAFAFSWATVQFRLDSIESLLIEQKADLKDVSRAVSENSARIAVLEDRSARSQ